MGLAVDNNLFAAKIEAMQITKHYKKYEYKYLINESGLHIVFEWRYIII